MNIQNTLLSPIGVTVITTMLSVDCAFAQRREPTDRIPRQVITLYNQTNIKLHYQIRLRSNIGGELEWGTWREYRHKYPNRCQFHYFDPDIEGIQIRFDRIGGDDGYTEQIYDLEPNVVTKSARDVDYRDGRPYQFRFDSGGQLLDLTQGGP